MRPITSTMFVVVLALGIASVAAAQGSSGIPTGGGSATKIWNPTEAGRPSSRIELFTLALAPLQDRPVRWWASRKTPRASSFYGMRPRDLR